MKAGEWSRLFGLKLCERLQDRPIHLDITSYYYKLRKPQPVELSLDTFLSR